jgi:hypothetical protein
LGVAEASFEAALMPAEPSALTVKKYAVPGVRFVTVVLVLVTLVCTGATFSLPAEGPM